MTMKATKLAAILSRLHSAWRLPQATLALALAIAAFTSPARAADGDLPDGYAALDGGLYKAAADNKILITDYWPNSNTWMEVELKFKNGSGGYDSTPESDPPDWSYTLFLGHCDLSLGAGHGCIARYPLQNDGSYWPLMMHFLWANGDVYTPKGSQANLPIPGNDATITLRLENGRLTEFDASGLQVGQATDAASCARAPGKADGPLALFGFTFSIAPFPYHSHDMTVYSLKIYESANGKTGDVSTLVRDYRPAEKDGQQGLYDVVGGNFFKLSDVSSSSMRIDFNGGTCAALSTFGMESVALVPVIPGEALPEFPAGALPTYSGKVLAGFYDGTKSDSIDGKTMYYTGDGKTQQICGTTPPTLHAVWVNWRYEINYALEGGHYPAENPAQDAVANQTVKIIAPVRNGYRFTGWKVSGYESGAKYALSEGGTENDVGSATVPCAADGSVYFKNLCSQSLPGADTVTLTAQWEYDIPGDYDSIDHLHFDGTHFILTDYCPIEKTWIETEMQLQGSKQTTRGNTIIGLREDHVTGSGVATLYYDLNFGDTESEKDLYAWALASSNPLTGRGWRLNSTESQFSAGIKSTIRFGYFGLTVDDGTSVKTAGKFNSGMDMKNYFPGQHQLVIGGLNGCLSSSLKEKSPGYGYPINPFSGYSGGLDVYSFNIYESANGSPADAEQTLKHNFIPVTNTTDKVAGLYDIFGQKFYPLQTQTIVTLNANGGNALATNYVYATAGEKMPSPIEVPTRNGYTFAGYSAEGWEVKPMTGKETDFISEGTGIWAYRAYNGSGARTVVNGTEFILGLFKGTKNQGPDATRKTDPDFTTDVEFNEFSQSTVGGEFNGCTPDYTHVVSERIEFQDTKDPRHDRVTFTLRQGLVAGKSYAVQIISYHKTTNTDAAPNNEPTNRLGFCENVYYENCAPVNPKGVSFVYRFKATGSTQSFTLYKPTEVKSASKTAAYLSISAIQLRELGSDVEDENPLLYYNADGTSDVTYPVSGGPTELYAQWELEPTEITGVLLADYEAVYDGSAKTPQIAAVMTASGALLTADDAALGWDVTYERERVATTDLVSEGRLQVVVIGKGKLSGTARANYRIVNPNKIALPKPTDVFKYTGAAITPTFTPTGGYTIAANGYVPAQGTTYGATAVGTYRVTCTLETGKRWENGSIAPYDVTWQIVDKTFLERLAADEYKVTSSPIATGGDLILKRGNTYIHVFTNTSEIASFTPGANLNARVLLVGGGGAGGYGGGNFCAGSGGGAGGMVEASSVGLQNGNAYQVLVGAGGLASASSDYPANKGTDTWIKFAENPILAIAFGGGGGGNKKGFQGERYNGQSGGSGGGGTWNKPQSGDYAETPAPGGVGIVGQGFDGGQGAKHREHAQAGGGGAGGVGGAGQWDAVGPTTSCGGIGRSTDILGFDQYFAGGGGGGGVTHFGVGGAGGGGFGRSFYTSNDLVMNGENGLGGGGGGGSGNTAGTSPYYAPGRGGDGIVIIAYEYVASGDSEAPVPESWNTVREVGWTGKTLIGVEAAPYGSTLSSNYYGDVEGTYTAVATLAPGYTKWADGETALSREIEWKIVDTKTWYLVVTDDPDADGYTQSSFSKNMWHWNRDPNATVGVSHQAAAGYHYVVPSGKIIALIHGGNTWDNEFAGESLALAGTMKLRNSNAAKYVKNWIGQGGEISAIDSGAYTFNGETFTILDGQSLTFNVARGTTSYDICPPVSGAGAILLAGNGSETSSGLKLSGDASAFTGAIALDPNSAAEPQNFTLTIANAFGGTVESLPSAANVTEVRFNSGANADRGLVVSSTEIPEALKTKLVVYGYNLTTADKPLVTFPAGTTVNAAEFAIKCAQNSTAAGSAVGALMTVENDDHTISLYPLRVNVTLDNDGGLPATQSVRVSAGGTMPTVAELPTKDGFAFLGYFSASGVRYYNADGTGARECDFTEATTLKAKWLSTEEYTLLTSLDNGNSLDAAGYVALTNFHLTGTNVVELKYQFNTDATHWQNLFMTRALLNGVRTEYGLVRVENSRKLQVSYGTLDMHNNANNSGTQGQGELVVRLCPTNDTSNGLIGYCNGSAITWEITTRKYTMFEGGFPCDLLLFTAEHPDKFDGKPTVDENGKLTSAALAKMYYFRVENSATDPTARLDLVPVRRTDGVRGFYDLVNGNFYPLKTPVVLDGNGGTPERQYVYTSKGEPMPALPNGAPTRPGYDFKGYYGATEGGTQYYGADGSVKAASCDFGEGTTLYAQWEIDKYHVINPETGPEIVVDYEWLKSAYGSDKSKAEYQQELFTTNKYGVVNWQAYILGYEPGEVSAAAIVEETAQNANPETVTIRLCGLPENPRTNATTRLAYSLYAARTTEAFAKGKDALVEKNGDRTPFEKSEKSTFEAPLSDLTDLEPVNYYRIRVHFIFNKSE